MATRPDMFPILAKDHAKAPELADFFRDLSQRAEECAKLHDDYLASITQHREERTGKPFRYTKRQSRFLQEFEADAEQARHEMEKAIVNLDDAGLLSVELSNQHQQLDDAEGMFATTRPEDRPMAQQLIDFHRETVRIIEQFIDSSPFEGQVKSLYRQSLGTEKT